VTSAGLMWANLWRRPTRTWFTTLSVMSAFLLYGVLSATHHAFVGGIDLVGDERLVTMHKIGFAQQMPLAYRQRIEATEGVRAVAAMAWLQGYFQEQKNFVPWIATDKNYFEMYAKEVVVRPAEGIDDFKRERTGAIVGEAVAARFGWKVGDTIPLRSGIWRNKDDTNTWELKVVGIYGVTNKAFDTESVISGYEYFDDSRTYGAGGAGWYVIQVADPARGAEISRAVDEQFANSSAQTKTSTEKAFAASFVGQLGDIGAIVTYVASAVLFSMLLVTANTMAQAVRERTAELAVLKALGFSERRVMVMVLGESVLITCFGAALGLALAWLLSVALYGLLARYMPAFAITGSSVLYGAGIALSLGLVAGAWPAAQAMRLRVVDALRRA
jgi:putative ABC transport system permease protein